MKEEDIVNKIKKDLYEKVKKQYEEYSLNNTPVNKEKYIKLLNAYKEINKCKTIDEINKCLKNIQAEIASLKAIYDSKVEEYKKDKTNQRLKKEYKDVASVAQVLTDLFSEIRIATSEYKKIVSSNISAKFKDSKPKIEQVETKKEEKKDEKPVEVKKYIDGVNFNIEPIKELQNINEQILVLREKLVTLDVKSDEAKELRKEIVELCSRREQIAYEANEYDGINLVKKIESLEIRYANAPLEKTKIEKEFDAEAYNKQLMEKITIIGDIIFFGTSSQYMDISKYPTEIQRKNEFNKILDKHKNEYINLVTSLYGKANPIIYKNGNQTKTAIDLIKKLGDFNIRGNYHDFKKHHKDGKLGNEALSKEMYDEGIKEIETLMNSFRVLSNETINQKGGTIKVTFDAETKSDLKQEIDRKMLELYRKVCDKNKSISM
jgi:hypothetical protein